MTKTIIDIHALQTLPPSNVNRDDTGSPKTATFGGVRRARVSSQSWKRATRLLFNENLDPSETGTRTKRIVEALTARIQAANPDLSSDRGRELANLALKVAGIKLSPARKTKDGEQLPEESGYLLFISARQLDHLAAAAAEANESDDAEAHLKSLGLKKALDTDHSIDLALFGRMVADSTDLNVDASAQVAHALSVHAVETEFDYFTAVDDYKKAQNEIDSGAGMIGTVEFNSSTLYRYATVDVDRLLDNLGSIEATKRAVEVFVDAFVRSLPSGKQNTFANRTLPDAVLVSLRDTQPVNLVGAFEEAVDTSATGGSRLHEASTRLVSYARELDDNFGTAPVRSWAVTRDATQQLAELGEKTDLTGLVSALGETVADRLAAQE